MYKSKSKSLMSIYMNDLINRLNLINFSKYEKEVDELMNNRNSIFTNVYSVILKRHTYPLPILKAYLNRCIKESKFIDKMGNGF